MKPNFNAMTKDELRSYVISHPHKKEAFYAFVDRFTADTSSETFSMAKSSEEVEEVTHLIQQKVKQGKQS